MCAVKNLQRESVNNFKGKSSKLGVSFADIPGEKQAVFKGQERNKLLEEARDSAILSEDKAKQLEPRVTYWESLQF